MPALQPVNSTPGSQKSDIMTVTTSGPDPRDAGVDGRTPLNASTQDAIHSITAPGYKSIAKGPTSDIHSDHGSDEERPLISPTEPRGNDVKALTSISTVIGVLLLGKPCLQPSALSLP